MINKKTPAFAGVLLHHKVYMVFLRTSILVLALLIVGYAIPAQADYAWNVTASNYNEGYLDNQNDGWYRTDGTAGDVDTLSIITEPEILNDNKVIATEEGTQTADSYYKRGLYDLNEYGTTVFSYVAGFQKRSPGGDTVHVEIYSATSTATTSPSTMVCRFRLHSDSDNNYNSIVVQTDLDGDSVTIPVASTTSFYAEIDTVNDTCRAFTSGTTTTNVSYSTLLNKDDPLTMIGLELNGGNTSGDRAWINQFVIVNYSAPTTPSCETCTRIISTEPGGNTAYSSSTELLSVTEYYVNSQDQANILGETLIEYTLTRLSDQSVETYTTPVTSFDTHYYVGNLLQLVTEEGSYGVTIRIYNDYPLGFDFDIAPYYYTSFYVGERTVFASTSAGQEIQERLGIIESTYGQINCEIDFPVNQDDFLCIAQYILATFIPTSDIFASEIKSLLKTIIYLPPWGYGTMVYTTLLNPATTTVPTLSLSFLEGTPGENITMTLNVTEGITMFNNTLNASSTSYAGTYGEQLLYYWNWLWYILFGIWIIREVFKLPIYVEGIHDEDPAGKIKERLETSKNYRLVRHK